MKLRTYKIFAKTKNNLAFEIVQKNLKYFDKKNNLINGKMKDEICGVTIKRFIGLEAKMYTYITEDQHDCKKATDMNNSFVKDKLQKENYKKMFRFMQHI